MQQDQQLNLLITDSEHDLERSLKIFYRICDAVACQNSNTLHLVMRSCEHKSVGFIVLIVTKESQWKALSTFLKIDTQD